MKAVLVFALALSFRWLLDQTPYAEYLKNFEFAILQSALRSDFAVAQPLSDKDKFIVPAVIDISPIPFDRDKPTDRSMLEELVNKLENMNAMAIGIDIDFSPDDRGDFITDRDPVLFDRWSKIGNIRIGVSRREGDPSYTWLGHRQFTPLAAGMMLPAGEAGYARLFGALSLQPMVGGRGGASLRQLPCALYGIVHGPDAAPCEPGEARGQHLATRFPIDYSLLGVIQYLRYNGQPKILDVWSEEIDRRAILIGDLRDNGDSRSIPGFDRPVAGVMIHAAALATLNRGLLRYVDHRESLLYEFGLFALVVAIGLAAPFTIRSSPGERMDENAVEILSSIAAALAVLAVSFLFLRRTRIFWPDFLWIAGAFLLHPYVGRVVGVLWKGTRAFLVGATKG